MSYCRWSTDDFQCDVYVYADAGGGWTTHVANNRYVYKEPLPPVVAFDPDDDRTLDAWFSRHNTIHEGQKVRYVKTRDCGESTCLTSDANK